MFSSVPVPTILSGIDFIHAPGDLDLVPSDAQRAGIKIHRQVMFCSSPFLHKLIQFESHGGKRINRVHLRHTSYSTLKVIVEFAYNGTVDFTELAIPKLLEEVDYLSVKGVHDLVNERLSTKPDNL